MPDHVEVRGDECTRRAVVHVAAHGQRLQEDFRHDDGRADVQHDAALQPRQVAGERRKSVMLVAPMAAPSARDAGG
jgi:hypothetical protein